MKPFTLLYKDTNLAVVDKSAGISSADCLQSLTNDLIMTTSGRLPKDFFIAPIGMLDSMVSGIQLFSLHPAITRELERNWNTRWAKKSIRGPG